MSGIGSGDWFNIVGGILSIIAFIFSVWIWMRSDFKQREMVGAIQSTYEVSGSILWEMHSMAAEDDATRLRQAERALGLVSAIHTISSKYADTPSHPFASELGSLVERGVIMPNSMLWNIEGSGDTKEVWLVTPDLEPDLSDPATGNLVNRNLRAGTNYVYFYPTTLSNVDEMKTRLLRNVGAFRLSRLANRVTFVPMEKASHELLLQHRNTILFFQGNPEEVVPHAFEEVALLAIPQRGFFWQKHDPTATRQLHQELRDGMRTSTGTLWKTV